MLISISKYTFLTIYFIFIHYIIVIIAFSLFFTFETKIESAPKLKKEIISLFIKENNFEKKNSYDHFYQKKVFYTFNIMPTLQLKNLLCFNRSSIAIPIDYYKESILSIPFCKTNLHYYDLDKSLLDQTTKIISETIDFLGKEKEFIIGTIEDKKTISIEIKEKKIIAYPWQSIPKECKTFLEEINKKNKKTKNQIIIDIRPYYKKNYEI
jgi:hypothetical protein